MLISGKIIEITEKRVAKNGKTFVIVRIFASGKGMDGTRAIFFWEKMAESKFLLLDNEVSVLVTGSDVLSAISISGKIARAASPTSHLVLCPLENGIFNPDERVENMKFLKEALAGKRGKEETEWFIEYMEGRIKQKKRELNDCRDCDNGEITARDWGLIGGGPIIRYRCNCNKGDSKLDLEWSEALRLNGIHQQVHQIL